MKKLISALALMLVISAASAMACTPPFCGPQTVTGTAWAVNGQGQMQGDIGGASPTAVGIVAGGVQGDFGKGGAIGSGSSAFDNQEQSQGNSGMVGTPTNGAGFSSLQEQSGGGHAAGLIGTYSYSGAQGQVGAAGAMNDGQGTAGVGGSGYLGLGSNQAAALGNAGAHQEQNQNFESGYAQVNQGPNGFTYVGGHQEAGTSNAVSVGRNEADGSNVVVGQLGGSVAINNGQGTGMIGGSGSFGSGTASVTDRCDAAAGFNATQVHEYEQGNVSNDGNSWQHASGTTSTTVSGTAGNVGLLNN